MSDESTSNSSESLSESSVQSNSVSPAELRWSRPDSEGHIPAPTVRDVTGGFSWTGERRDTHSRSNTISEAGVDSDSGPTIAEGSTDQINALVEQEFLERATRFKDPLIGTVLDGKYRILSVLGFGGMSVVYKAEQELIEKFVAVKTVKFRVDERPSLWQRFEREVKTLSRLSHPNIVTVYDCVLGDDGQPYVVMDYLEGLSLDQVLQEKGRFSIKQLLSVACQACSAVGHAHRNDVIHRDIKPANIMLIEQKPTLPPEDGQADEIQYQIKVVDFGLAKLGEDSRKLTQSGELWGSPPYMSPEQIIGGDCDGRSDIYSLGCVIYELATGRDPFWSANVYELLHKHLNEEPPTIQEACPEGSFPPHLQAVLEKAMAKNPDERFSTMLEFRDALEAACNYCVESGLPPPVVRKPGQTGYRMPEMRTTTSKAAAVSGSGKPAAPPPTAPSPLSPDNPPVAVPDVVHHPEAVGYNMYLTWTMTGLLVAACILFVFNETSRPKPYVKRNPYHSITRSIPIAPVPPPVSQVQAVSRAKPATAKVGLSRTAAVFTAPVRVRRHKELAEMSAGVTEKEREREHRVAVKKTPKTSPNSSVPPVDQSKFDMLRRLKSAPLKNEGSE